MATKTYGTVSPEQQKAMSALQFVMGLASGELPLNMIAQTLSYDLVEAESGRVTGAKGPIARAWYDDVSHFPQLTFATLQI
jgi:hypothetical protein